MAKTWYSVVKVEHILPHGGGTLMAGTVCTVAKFSDMLVRVTQVHGSECTYYLTPEQCRMIMTQPTQDLDSAMEQSFLCCEAAYC